MKFAILSRNAKLYSTQRLVEAARARGHTVRVLDPLRCYMAIAPGAFRMHYKGKPLPPIDAVVPRIGASATFYGTAVLRQLELMGASSPNPSDAILRARDKLRCHQMLAGEGLGLPLRSLEIELGPSQIEAVFDALDALIDAQAYRLAHCRIAADEINYRRFFDINELAALRMERARSARPSCCRRSSNTTTSRSATRRRFQRFICAA